MGKKPHPNHGVCNHAIGEGVSGDCEGSMVDVKAEDEHKAPNSILSLPWDPRHPGLYPKH
jgi:hypothetical protein